MLRFLSDEAKRRPDEYNKFFFNFGQFLKEGICADREWKSAACALQCHHADRRSQTKSLRCCASSRRTANRMN